MVNLIRPHRLTVIQVELFFVLFHLNHPHPGYKGSLDSSIYTPAFLILLVLASLKHFP